MKGIGNIKDPLKWVSVAAALAVTATAEYDLAVAIGVNSVVAAAVPAALDAYVLRALQRNKEVLTSVLAMVGVNAASHLQHAGMIPLDWRLTTAVSAIAPLVLWRVHALKDPGTWRREKLWGRSMPVDAEHGGEHERVPDEDTSTGDGAREHSNVHVVTGKLCSCPHAEDDELCVCTYGCPLPCSLGTDDLDVPDWLREAQDDPNSVLRRGSRVLATVPPAPVFAPYVDHVDAEHADTHATCSDIPGQGPACDWDPACAYHFPDTGTGSTDRHLSAVPPLPAAFTRSTDRADAKHGSEHTTDHDGLNLGHVSTGVLLPADTRHMERARVLMVRTGSVPTVRALKQTLGTGTPVAQRVRAALTIEHTTSTDGGTA